MKNLRKYFGRKSLIVALAIALMAVILFWHPYGLLLAGGLLALCAGALGWSVWRQARYMLRKKKYGYCPKDAPLKCLASAMGLLFVVSTVLYMWIFHLIDNNISNAQSLFRSMGCAFEQFFFDMDSPLLDELNEKVEKPWLGGLISTLGALSFACTVTMLIGLAYSRLRAYLRLRVGKAGKGKDHLYLFFGNNEPSRLLISEIVKKDPKALVIIIDEANVNEESNDEMASIIGLLTHRPKVFKVANDVGAHVAIASQQLHNIDPKIVSEGFDAFACLGLESVKKYIDDITPEKPKDQEKEEGNQELKPQLHIFFMSEDEDQNIRNIITLAKDKTICAVAANGNMRHRIYCHARHNGPNSVIEDVAVKKKLELQIVDSSHLAVELLKLDPERHPVHVVELNPDDPGTVSSKFTAMVIGFGQVGRDAFRFLYEFGAFVNSADPCERSPFECVIVDKDIDRLKGPLMASMPNIFTPGNKLVRFVNADCSSQGFNDSAMTDDFMREVNYIVISIGNDDDGIALAVRLFLRAWSLRDVANLRIFVKCSDDSKAELMQKIADHYNHGYGRGNDNTPVIRIFGQPSKTYTYDLVVSERLVKQGKLYFKNYSMLFDGSVGDWDKRHRKHAHTDTPNLQLLRALRRKESQDLSNALHAGTKTLILKKFVGEDNWDSLYQRLFSDEGTVRIEGACDQIHYPGLTEAENKLMLRLAQLEHLRWNAAQELMGYVHIPNCDPDDRALTHNCLCRWDKLETKYDYKKYDFNVVHTSIYIDKNEPEIIGQI